MTEQTGHEPHVGRSRWYGAKGWQGRLFVRR